MCKTGPHSRFADGEVNNLDTDRLDTSQADPLCL